MLMLAVNIDKQDRQIMTKQEILATLNLLRVVFAK